MPGGGGRETGVSAGSVVASRMGALCVAAKQRGLLRPPARPWSSDRSGPADRPGLPADSCQQQEFALSGTRGPSWGSFLQRGLFLHS